MVVGAMILEFTLCFVLHAAGIVTRRPLVLQLVRLEDPAARAHGEFLHIGPRPFYSFGAPLCESCAAARHEQISFSLGE
jgi:hypothetical protein